MPPLECVHNPPPFSGHLKAVGMQPVPAPSASTDHHLSPGWTAQQLLTDVPALTPPRSPLSPMLALSRHPPQGGPRGLTNPGTSPLPSAPSYGRTNRSPLPQSLLLRCSLCPSALPPSVHKFLLVSRIRVPPPSRGQPQPPGWPPAPLLPGGSPLSFAVGCFLQTTREVPLGGHQVPSLLCPWCPVLSGDQNLQTPGGLMATCPAEGDVQTLGATSWDEL